MLGVQGLSPRERGNHPPPSIAVACYPRQRGRRRTHDRSIPARAGEPRPRGLAGHIPTRAGEPWTAGQRSIPARAGEPRPAGPPRVTSRSASRVDLIRSIPARAGEPVIHARHARALRNRSIPARAGEPSLEQASSSPDTTQLGLSPRERGNQLVRAVGRQRPCLSPRERGNPPWCGGRCYAKGSIPARAGEPTRECPSCHTRSIVSSIDGARSRVYPRASGGTPRSRSHPRAGACRVRSGVYPRASGGTGAMRPNPRAGLQRVLARSIPARAGEPKH